MFLVDPDDGKTISQIIKKVLDRRPELKAELEEISQRSGRSVDQLAGEALAIGLRQLQDPENRAALVAKVRRNAQPFGADPRLGTNR